MILKTFLKWSVPLIVSISSVEAAPATLRPGLWEHTTAIKSQSGEMEKAKKQMDQQMASMPPEQRKMMEQMMASQGIAQTPQGNSVKTCITPQDAKLNIVPQTDQRCKQQILKQSGNSVRFKYECQGNPHSSGEGEYIIKNNKAYTGKMSVRTTVQGHTEVMQMDQSGKWLSDDCGKLKPLSR